MTVDSWLSSIGPHFGLGSVEGSRDWTGHLWTLSELKCREGGAFGGAKFKDFRARRRNFRRYRCVITPFFGADTFDSVELVRTVSDTVIYAFSSFATGGYRIIILSAQRLLQGLTSAIFFIIDVTVFCWGITTLQNSDFFNRMIHLIEGEALFIVGSGTSAGDSDTWHGSKGWHIKFIRWFTDDWSGHVQK